MKKIFPEVAEKIIVKEAEQQAIDFTGAGTPHGQEKTIDEMAKELENFFKFSGIL